MQQRVKCKDEFASAAGLWELTPRLCSRPGREAYWRPAHMAVAELPVRRSASVPSAAAAGADAEPEPEPECTLLHTAGPAVRLRSVDRRRGGAARIDVITRAEAFREQPTCLDLRPGTQSELNKGTSALAVIGVHSGEVILLDPLQQRVLAIWNKGHLNAAGRCTDVAWAPHDPLQFAASFASGIVLLFELGRLKEDKLGDGAREPKSTKHNPRQRWVVCKDPVLALKYGPPTVSATAGLLAVAAGDGALRLFDTATGLPTLTFTSYFGGVRCIDWSTDGKYLVAGGEDDNVVMWSLPERRQIARCVGHSSWVSSVLFLPWPSAAGPGLDTAQDGVYTFASAGWDHRLCIWEVDTKVVGAGKQEQRESESAMVVAAAGERDRSVGRVAPVVNEVSLHANPLSALAASADHLFTGCDGNELKAWARPAIVEPPPITVGSGDKDDDGLVDVESDADSDERDEAQMAGTPPRERHSRGVTADV